VSVWVCESWGGGGWWEGVRVKGLQGVLVGEYVRGRKVEIST